METVKVTILMPVYNGEVYLKKAIDSILKQTYRNFEFLIILEAETIDDSYKIIKSYKDTRIRLIENKNKIGLIASLNKGIDLAKGKYIVRMDCDDISLPRRVEYQVKFMNKNKDIIMSGTNCYIIGLNDKKNDVLIAPKNDKSIKFFSFFGTPFFHPTVIMRRKEFIKNKFYYEENCIAEDYELWLRVVKTKKVSNIQKKLVLYRIHNNNRCKNFSREVFFEDCILKKEYWKKNGVDYELKKPFFCSALRKGEITQRDILIKELYKKFGYFEYDKKTIESIVFNLYISNNIEGLELYKNYWITYGYLYKKYVYFDKLRILIKCFYKYIIKNYI